MAKEKETFLFQETLPSIKQSAILRDSYETNELIEKNETNETNETNGNLNFDLLSQGPSFLKNICFRLRIRFKLVKSIALLIACWLFYLALKRVTYHNQKPSETIPAKNLNNIKNILNTSLSQPSWNYDVNEVCVLKNPIMSLSDIQVAKLGWKSFLKSVQPKIDSSISIRKEGDPKTRGIVYTGHSGVLKQFVLSVKMLRKFKCNLPIEFWHFDEITEKETTLLTSSMDLITVRNMKTILDSPLKLKKEDGRMWEMKGASILHSSFDQVLFLDTDNVPAKDPTFLFDSQPFRETGAIFWKDFGKLSNDNPIWSILEISCTTEFEQESGQVLIDKSRPDTLKAMYLAAYMQQERKLYFSLFWGDKETFRLAWRAVKAPYHMIRPHLAAVGIQKPSIDKFCGHTMVQFGPMWIPSIYGKAPSSWNEPSKPEIVFMHANIFKYEHIEENGKFFPRLIRYRHPEARKNHGGAFDSKSGLCTFLEDYIEDNGLTNQVIQEQLSDHLPAFEADFRQLEIEAGDYLSKN